MSLRLNDIVLDFTAQSTEGDLVLHDWIGDSYAILFSHPKDFIPVCTIEFGAVAQLADEFARRNTKVAGILVDGVEEHMRWKADVETYFGKPVTFPIIADSDLEIVKLYDMLFAEAYLPEGRTAVDTVIVWTTFIIGPDKKIRLVLIYLMLVGRNFDEILRALDAIQVMDGVSIAMPADWRSGQDVIAALLLIDDQARARFGDVEIVLLYLRMVKVFKVA